MAASLILTLLQTTAYVISEDVCEVFILSIPLHLNVIKLTSESIAVHCRWDFSCPV